jgi:peptidoglycan/LPS O-acetylase OafA/YrhL
MRMRFIRVGIIVGINLLLLLPVLIFVKPDASMEPWWHVNLWMAGVSQVGGGLIAAFFPKRLRRWTTELGFSVLLLTAGIIFCVSLILPPGPGHVLGAPCLALVSALFVLGPRGSNDDNDFSFVSDTAKKLAEKVNMIHIPIARPFPTPA